MLARMGLILDSCPQSTKSGRSGDWDDRRDMAGGGSPKGRPYTQPDRSGRWRFGSQPLAQAGYLTRNCVPALGGWYLGRRLEEAAS
jgi:hypothetical protein